MIASVSYLVLLKTLSKSVYLVIRFSIQSAISLRIFIRDKPIVDKKIAIFSVILGISYVFYVHFFTIVFAEINFGVTEGMWLGFMLSAPISLFKLYLMYKRFYLIYIALIALVVFIFNKLNLMSYDFFILVLPLTIIILLEFLMKSRITDEHVKTYLVFFNCTVLALGIGTFIHEGHLFKELFNINIIHIVFFTLLICEYFYFYRHYNNYDIKASKMKVFSNIGIIVLTIICLIEIKMNPTIEVADDTYKCITTNISNMDFENVNGCFKVMVREIKIKEKEMENQVQSK